MHGTGMDAEFSEASKSYFSITPYEKHAWILMAVVSSCQVNVPFFIW
jgi:hypothetical protein